MSPWERDEESDVQLREYFGSGEGNGGRYTICFVNFVFAYVFLMIVLLSRPVLMSPFFVPLVGS